MEIRFVDGRSKLEVTDERHAEQVLRQLYPGARFGAWEDSRKLVWRSERELDEDSETGGFADRAVAMIVRD
jgi:hypothetical protein